MVPKIALLTAIVVLAMTFLFDYLDLLPLGRRPRRRVERALFVVIFGTIYLSPSSFTTALDWISRQRSKQIVEMIQEVMPTTSTSSPTATTP